MANKGIVVKVKDSHCIILSGDGAYEKIPLSRVKNPRVGAETEYSPLNWVNRLKPLLMVACLLVFVLGLNMFRLAQQQMAEAYVSLDINPSVELAVDRNVKVVEVNALNDDAKKLISDMDLEGKNLYAALRQIVNEAAVEGYIKSNQKNYVLSTVTAGSDSQNLINYDNIAVNLQESVSEKDLDVEFVILAADMKVRNDARNKGLSTGKMMIYQNSLDSGEQLTVEQVKENSLTKLVNTHKIKLVPANYKALVKTIHVPPGQLKKSNPPSGSNSLDKPQADTNVEQTDPGKTQGQGKGQQGSNGQDIKDKSKDKAKDKTESGYSGTESGSNQIDPDNSTKTKKHSKDNVNDEEKTKIPKNNTSQEINPDDTDSSYETDSTDGTINTDEQTDTKDGKDKKKAKSHT